MTASLLASFVKRMRGIYPSASIGSFMVRVTMRFDVVRTYFYFRVRVSGFRILVGIFARIVFQRSNLRCFSREHRKRIRRNFRFVEADESNHGIIGTELQGTVETELFLICPVGDTVENCILLAIFGHLAFAVASRAALREIYYCHARKRSSFRWEKRRGPVEVRRRTAVQ